MSGRVIPAIEPTWTVRGDRNELLSTTYAKARSEHNYIECYYYHHSPMLNMYNGIITPKLVQLCEWVSKKILLQIDMLPNKSLAVLTRIATGMLNNLENYVRKEDRVLLHNNLIFAIKWLRTEYIVANLRNSPNELPF